jgi:photosystem II stability/assembly factor-like uncharacterized protein
MRMRGFYIVVALFALATIPALLCGITWEQQESPTWNGLYSLCATDANHAWACGEAGTIIRTVDGGQNWTLLNSGTTTGLGSVYFADDLHGWVSGALDWNVYHGTILNTTDGGDTWTMQNMTAYQDITRMTFLDGNLGWALGIDHTWGDDATIYRTTDCGANWPAICGLGMDIYVNNFCFADSLHGWATGRNQNPFDYYNFMYATSDGGYNWHEQLRPEQMMNSITFIDSLRGWAVGPYGTALRTNDGGVNWTAMNLGDTDHFYIVRFTDALHGWTTGYTGVILYTDDGGDSWTPQTTPHGYYLDGLAIVDGFSGWAVGEYGSIVHAADATPATDSAAPLPTGLTAIVSPNPFNPTTRISYNLPADGPVSLTIHDLRGRLVATLVEGREAAGEHSAMWNGTGVFGRPVASGVYVFRLRSGSGEVSGKCLLLK